MDWSDLPMHLREQAVFLAGEPAWPREAAQEVIISLRDKEQAILGVEAWFPEQGMPRVVGWSDYDIPKSSDWKEFVRLNALQALSTIDNSNLQEALYNLTWSGENDSG